MTDDPFTFFYILLAGTAVFGVLTVCQIMFHRFIGKGRAKSRRQPGPLAMRLARWGALVWVGATVGVFVYILTVYGWDFSL